MKKWFEQWIAQLSFSLILRSLVAGVCLVIGVPFMLVTLFFGYIYLGITRFTEWVIGGY